MGCEIQEAVFIECANSAGPLVAVMRDILFYMAVEAGAGGVVGEVGGGEETVLQMLVGTGFRQSGIAGVAY